MFFGRFSCENHWTDFNKFFTSTKPIDKRRSFISKFFKLKQRAALESDFNETSLLKSKY